MRLTDPPELALLVLRFCEIHRRIFDREFWIGRKWLRGMDCQRIEDECRQFLLFLNKHRMPVSPQFHTWEGYLKFALWEQLLNDKKAATPKCLISDARVRRYFDSDRPIYLPASPAKSEKLAAARAENRNAYRQWNEADKELLRQRYKAGESVAQLAAYFGRAPGGIQSQLFKLGLVEDWKVPT